MGVHVNEVSKVGKSTETGCQRGRVSSGDDEHVLKLIAVVVASLSTKTTALCTVNA